MDGAIADLTWHVDALESLTCFMEAEWEEVPELALYEAGGVVELPVVTAEVKRERIANRKARTVSRKAARRAKSLVRTMEGR